MRKYSFLSLTLKRFGILQTCSFCRERKNIEERKGEGEEGEGGDGGEGDLEGNRYRQGKEEG